MAYEPPLHKVAYHCMKPLKMLQYSCGPSPLPCFTIQPYGTSHTVDSVQSLLMFVAMFMSCFVRSRTLFCYFRWLSTVYKIHFADAWTINEPYLPAGQDVIQYRPLQRTHFSQYQTISVGWSREMLPTLAVGWQASAVRDEEAGRCRKVAGTSIVAAGIWCSVVDTYNCRQPSGFLSQY